MDLNPLLMRQLVKTGVYSAVHVYDFQGMCKYTEDTVAAATSLQFQNPVTLLLNVLAWFWREMTLLLLEHSLYSWWLRRLVYSAHGSTLFANWDRHYTPCHKQVTLYNVNWAVLQTAAGQTVTSDYCDGWNCVSYYNVVHVDRTNLMMLTLNKHCRGCADTDDDYNSQNGSLDGVQIDYTENRCRRFRQDVYRRRPLKCFSRHPNEKPVSCAAASGPVELSTALGICCLLYSLALAWRPRLRVR
ncbi:PREDICTED: voltage-dependent calcium channel subunit alpha-2/delta-4-like [Priapulus caudatus]|uniref:Voltage-dependent calcium channel subunit alpha-2/delta-4-like n=1 Tax=Priapulus caudatus TaxID=37621 RepID=A0ABM1EYV3_PRICU|nr:PREDICTED: voltage-dependent calcium channel subunit alpha-2/delta-4-like [Priapulus caudatus]